MTDPKSLVIGALSSWSPFLVTWPTSAIKTLSKSNSHQSKSGNPNHPNHSKPNLNAKEPLNGRRPKRPR